MKSVLVLCFIAIISVSLATDVIIYADEDSYLNSGAPTTNYGTLSTGYCGQDTQSPYPFYDIVVKFNISSLPSSISSAYVHYNQQFVSEDEILGPYITVNCYEVMTNWTESGIGSVTWSNPPVNIKQTCTDYQDNNIYEISFPATTVVVDGLNGGKQMIAMRVKAISVVTLFMKESSISDRPYMVVTL